MLQLDIECEDFGLTGEVDEYIRQRAARLDRFFTPITRTRVVLEAPVNHHRQGGPFTVRIDIDVPGTAVTVSRQQSDDLHVAIRTSFESAERQLQDYRRKRQGQVKTPAAQPVAKVARLFPREGYGFLAASDQPGDGPQASTVEVE